MLEMQAAACIRYSSRYSLSCLCKPVMLANAPAHYSVLLLDTVAAFLSCGLQVAVMPNTLAFNHALTALDTAATNNISQPVAPLLAEHAVKLFYSMQNRAGSPPDHTTHDLVMAVLSKCGAEGQALQVHQLKLQRVGFLSALYLCSLLCDSLHSGNLLFNILVCHTRTPESYGWKNTALLTNLSKF